MCACLNVCFSPLRENLFRNKERFKGKNFYVRVGEKVFKAEILLLCTFFNSRILNFSATKATKRGTREIFGATKKSPKSKVLTKKVLLLKSPKSHQKQPAAQLWTKRLGQVQLGLVRSKVWSLGQLFVRTFYVRTFFEAPNFH